MKHIRWICFGICILAVFSGKICAQAVSGLSAVRVAFGLTQPVFVTALPGDTRRLFIVRQSGQVHILNLTTGKLNATPFLDIHARLIPALRGTYVFADYLGPEPGSQGKIFTLNYDGATALNFQNITAKLFPTKVGGTC